MGVNCGCQATVTLVIARAPGPTSRMVSGVRWDRWVLPPAVSAAVFAVLSVSPPIASSTASVYRLESLGDPSAGRPWLLRARITGESVGTPSLRLTSPDATVESAASLHDRGGWFRALVPASASELRLHLRDASGVHRLRAAVGPLRALSAAPRVDERVLVVEGTLVPELTGEVIVRPDGGSVALLPVTDQVAIEPARRAVDECGLASFSVRVSGLGAPVSMIASGPSGERRDELRLPLVPGGIAVRDEGDAVLLRATSPGSIAHLVAGDASGPTWWSAAELVADGEEGSARVPLPPGALWITASRSGDLSEPVSPLLRPTSPPCVATPLGQRLARARLAPPVLPGLRVLWDGPSEGAERTRQRVQRARALCVGGLAVSVALEVLLLLGAGLASGPTSLRALAGDRRDRLGILAAGISTLLLMGVALALAVGIRAP